MLALTCLLNTVFLQRSVNLLCLFLFCKKTIERITEETEKISEDKVSLLRTHTVPVGRSSVSAIY